MMIRNGKRVVAPRQDGARDGLRQFLSTTPSEPN